MGLVVLTKRGKSQKSTFKSRNNTHEHTSESTGYVHSQEHFTVKSKSCIKSYILNMSTESFNQNEQNKDQVKNILIVCTFYAMVITGHNTK